MNNLTTTDLKKIAEFKKQLTWLIKNHETTYFDNAATSLKPDFVGKLLAKGINNKTFNYEKLVFAQKVCADFFSMPPECVGFTSGATFSANATAQYLKKMLKIGDQIILSKHEHGSNIIPWQEIAKETKTKIIYLDAKNPFNIKNMVELVNSNTKIVSFANCTNLTAQIIDAEELAVAIKKKNSNAIVVVDATQFLQHNGMSLKNSKIDFTFGSAHKMFAPNGLGFLIANPKHLKDMENSLIRDWVVFAQWFHQENPNFYQIDYNALEPFAEVLLMIQNLTLKLITTKEKELINYFLKNFPKDSGFQIINSDILVPIFLLNHPKVPAQDISHYLNDNNVLTRSGMSCAVLADQVLKTKEVVRVSLSFYNDFKEIDILFDALNKFKKNFLDYL